MKYKITKLDRRHNGFGSFKYSISPISYSNRVDDLIELRNWCWMTYGPGTELKYFSVGNTWAWNTEYEHRKIYLKSDEEMVVFKLKYYG